MSSLVRKYKTIRVHRVRKITVLSSDTFVVDDTVNISHTFSDRNSVTVVRSRRRVRGVVVVVTISERNEKKNRVYIQRVETIDSNTNTNAFATSHDRFSRMADDDGRRTDGLGIGRRTRGIVENVTEERSFFSNGRQRFPDVGNRRKRDGREITRAILRQRCRDNTRRKQYFDNCYRYQRDRKAKPRAHAHKPRRCLQSRDVTRSITTMSRI